MSVSRVVEDGGYIAAVIVGLIYVLAESAARVGFCAPTGCPSAAGIPWGVVVIETVLVMPKTVGRASTGRIWEAAAGVVGRVTNRRGSDLPPPPPESPAP